VCVRFGRGKDSDELEAATAGDDDEREEGSAVGSDSYAFIDVCGWSGTCVCVCVCV